MGNIIYFLYLVSSSSRMIPESYGFVGMIFGKMGTILTKIVYQLCDCIKECVVLITVDKLWPCQLLLPVSNMLLPILIPIVQKILKRWLQMNFMRCREQTSSVGVMTQDELCRLRSQSFLFLLVRKWHWSLWCLQSV